MRHEEIKNLADPAERIQHLLADKVIKPLNWIGKKILALTRELKFFQYRLKFGQRDDDIYVVTFVKSGTTLMQMMLYQMTTSGEVDFNHIYEVSPWIRNDSFRNKPVLNFPSPRIIKSHEPISDFEKGTKGRFIHVIRDGKDVLVSLYHQSKNYNNPNQELKETFKNVMVSGGEGNWFRFNRKWYENKKKLNILYLRYEDILSNKEEAIKKIAAFLNLKLTPEIIKRTMERSSFEFMKQHEDKFGEQPIERVYNQFIRKGKIGEGEEQMNENQKKYFQEQYDKQLAKFLKS